MTDSSGIQRFDPVSDFKEINDCPCTRFLKIDLTDKGFPDIMNYWGMNGTSIVNSKVKKLMQEYYGELAMLLVSKYSFYTSNHFVIVHRNILYMCDE